MTVVVVTAAVIEEQDRFLVTRRLAGTHLAGAWEFPGGKCHPGEPLEACMAREILEELGVGCDVGDELFTIAHQYADRQVELHFYAVRLHAPPQPMLGQEMQWVARDRLTALDFPPADAELIRLLAAGTRSGIVQGPDRP